MKVRILKPLAYDGRRERDEIVEMDEATVSAYGPEYVEKVGENAVQNEKIPAENETDNSGNSQEEEIEKKRAELKKTPKEDLKVMLQEKGVVFDESATKEELINLLLAQ